MKNKLSTIIMAVAVILLSGVFLLAGCGGSGSSTTNQSGIITGISFDQSFATIEYTPYPFDDPFGIHIVYSDGSRVRWADTDIDLEVTVTKWDEVTQQEVPFTGTDLRVGNYSFTYKYGNISSQASLLVTKGTYTGNVFVNINQNMRYSEALAKPSISSFSASEITDVQYYYHKVIDAAAGEYGWDYMYEWTQDAICEMEAGNYQIWAVITTKDYEDITTQVRSFTVQRANKTNYKLFADQAIYDAQTETYHWEMLPLESAVELTYHDNQSETLYDYIGHLHNVYIYEVDEYDQILYDEDSRPLGMSMQDALNSETAELTISTQNSTINAAGTYSVSFRYTSNRNYYNQVNKSFQLKINKIKVNVTVGNVCIELEPGHIYSGAYPYDGLEHHIEHSGYVREENGIYYVYTTYYNGQQEVRFDLYTITNYAATNAGTYTVTCTVLPSLVNCVEFEWQIDDQVYTGTNVTLGTWTIAPFNYTTRADIKLNNKELNEYSYSWNNVVLLKGNTYTVDVSNIEAIRYEDIDDDGIDDEIVVPNAGLTFSGISIYAYIYQDEQWEWIDVTTGHGATVTQTDNVWTIEFEPSYPYDHIDLYFNFDTSDTNYIANSIEYNSVYIYESVQFECVDARIVHEGYAFEYQYIETHSSGYSEYYVSADQATYQKWSQVYNTLYYYIGNEPTLNTSSSIDWNRTYYVLDGTEYQQVKFYWVTYSDEATPVQTNNTVKYDGKAKKLDDVAVALQIDAVSWNDIYNSSALYVRESDSYVPNNSNNVFDYNKEYYKKVGEEYIRLYPYRKVGNGYVYLQRNESVTDYYLAPGYYYASDNNATLEQRQGDVWVEVDEAREIGKYRTRYGLVLSGNRVAVDGQGNYLSQVYYEWEIVDGSTPRIAYTNYTLSFTYPDGTAVEAENIDGNSVTYDSSVHQSGVYLTLNLTFDDPTVEYVVAYVTTREGYQGGYSISSYAQGNETDTYTTRVYIAFDGDYLLTDSDGNVLEYITIVWNVTDTNQA